MTERVASRYAKALLDLAIEKNALAQVDADMLALYNTCQESKDLVSVLKSPVISPYKKVDIVDTIFKGMNQMSISFMHLIIKNGRSNLLLEIAESFIALSKKHRGILDVYLTSASVLTAETKNKIVAKVKTKHQGEINLIEKIDASLIGGFIVRMDDEQIDASISNQLSNLKNIILN